MQHWARSIINDAIWDGRKSSEQIIIGLKRIAEIIESKDVYCFRTPDLEKFCDALFEVGDLSELSDKMMQIANYIGFQNFAIFVLQTGKNNFFRSRICTSFGEDWIARYQQMDYRKIDPVIARAGADDSCFLFSNLDSSSTNIENFWADASNHNIGRNGMCFVFPRIDGSRIGVSFVTENNSEYVEELHQVDGSDLHFLSLQAVNSFCDLSIGNKVMDDTLNLNELHFSKKNCL